jgi:urea transport system ATP-binding protein
MTDKTRKPDTAPNAREHDERSGASFGHVTQSDVDTRHGVMLYLEDICVDFDGFRALNRLTMDVGVGELRCVIGPNGAGKTTMMDVITGKTRPTSGTAYFGQNIDLSRLSETEIAHAGIGRKFQRPTVFEHHTVYENLELAIRTGKSVSDTLRARPSPEQADQIDALLDLIRLQGVITQPAGTLSHGQKQWLEIGMLLMQQPRLLLLDEPVAGMTDSETERTGELLLALKGKHAMMVIEHDMDFIANIVGDGKVTVLHEGSVLAEGSMHSVQSDERVIEVYLGR